MRFNAGVIGCGRIGSLLSEDKLREKPCTHAESLSKNQNVQLIAGADTEKDRLKFFSKKWNVKKVYTDYRQMLEENKFDIISIATSANTHVKIIEDCIKHKTRVILCEKPLSIDIKEAEKAVVMCKSAGILLVVNHSRRFSGDYLKVRDLLRSGIIGELKTIHANVSAGAPKPEDHYDNIGGGILLHDGTHLIDTLRFLLGEKEPDNIYAQLKFANNGAKVEQNLQALLHYSEGFNVFIDCSDRDYFHFEIDIHGDKGRILIGNGIHHYFIKTESPYYEGFNSLTEKPFPFYDKTPFFEVLVDSLVKNLKTGEIPESCGDQALLTLKLVMAIYKSAIDNEKIAYPANIIGNPFEAKKGII